MQLLFPLILFFFNDPATTEIYTLSLHDALPILARPLPPVRVPRHRAPRRARQLPLAGEELLRSEEHTSELQSQSNLVCRLLLEKKKKKDLPVVHLIGTARYEVPLYCSD